jgi:glycosyltransferase involved in cell wall biosynthesis
MQQKTVAILLAVYDPREDWLIELLDSLNQQTYPSLRLYVRDDASPHYPLTRLEELLKERITRFPFVLARNEKNLGSNETFAALVRDCHEPYIAFCDQDDVWLADKLANTVRLFEESELHPTLVCTNVRVIDGEGKVIADTMEEHRRRHVYLRGKDLAGELIYRNFAMGCTVIMERERALSYLPFPAAVVHDHYLAFRAAADGAIDFLAEPQILYRVYGGNQTGVMTGVATKEDYLKRRIHVFDDRVSAFAERVTLPALEDAVAWSRARLANFHREKGGFTALWKTSKVNRVTSLFELFALRMPTPIFRFLIRLVQKGVL